MDKVKSSSIKQAIRAAASAYAWPGGYPLYLVMKDGSTLCPTCVRESFRTIYKDSMVGYGPSFEVAGVDINWEDSHLYCDNCSTRIESAYSDD